MKILERILEEKQNRKTLVKEFQMLIWNDENAREILLELAYDLDFYEPNEEWQNENLNYYGDEKLETKIKSVIQELKNSDCK